MGTTSAFGRIAQIPYGLVRNIRQSDTERVTVIVTPNNGQTRDMYSDKLSHVNGIPFYDGDTVKILFTKGSLGATQVCDIVTVHPTTGAESVASTRSFSAARQKAVVITCSAIDANSGVATVAVTYEVW